MLSCREGFGEGEYLVEFELIFLFVLCWVVDVLLLIYVIDVGGLDVVVWVWCDLYFGLCWGDD